MQAKEILTALDSSNEQIKQTAIKEGLGSSDKIVKRKAILRGLRCGINKIEARAKEELIELLISIIESSLYDSLCRLIQEYFKPKDFEELQSRLLDALHHIFTAIYQRASNPTFTINKWESYIYHSFKYYFYTVKHNEVKIQNQNFQDPLTLSLLERKIFENIEEEYFDYEAYKIALSYLSEEQRRLIQLRFEEGLKPREFYQEFNTSIENVRFRLYNAKSKLKKYYDKITQDKST